jgi:predicted aspartyl protease
MRARSFTIAAKGLARNLKSVISVSAHNPDGIPHFTDFKGLWDTGATGSVITQKVVDKLKLTPIDFVTVHHAHGESPLTEVYIVDFGLPNKVGLSGLRVTKGVLGDIDVLIGMDVIGSGDFAVSNYDGKTVFTFRSPSLEHADFTGNMSKPAAPTQPPIGRNDPCSCGSGKKFKKCCGS